MGSLEEPPKIMAVSPLDDEFTNMIIDSMGPKTAPRMREVMTVMIKHIHAFAKECKLTESEWHLGMKLLNDAGRMSNDRVNHMQILMDCIGLET